VSFHNPVGGDDDMKNRNKVVIKMRTIAVMISKLTVLLSILAVIIESGTNTTH
jgi:hypothetical protein